jgi:hypothetical protein
LKTYSDKYSGVEFPENETKSILVENVFELVSNIENKKISHPIDQIHIALIDNILELIRHEKYKIERDLFWHLYKVIMDDLDYAEKVKSLTISFPEQSMVHRLCQISESELYSNV